MWCIGRLQTDADRARVIDGLGSSDGQEGPTKTELTNIVKRLKPRWFLFRDVHAKESTLLMQPRHAMSFMRGPMTRVEIRRALEVRRVGRARRWRQRRTPRVLSKTQWTRWRSDASGCPCLRPRRPL